MQVSIKSPTRVDLAGGTLDCWPLFNFIRDCCTVNLSISIYTSAELSTREDGQIHIHLDDLEYHQSFGSIDDFQASKDSPLKLIQATTEYWRPHKGFNLRTSSQSPVGAGLGGSSSLIISLLKAFAQVFKKDWDVNEMVTVAHNIEARLLHTPTGTQDYFPAAQPGLNVIYYSEQGFKSERISFDAQTFQSHMVLVYTGRPHHSGINNWQVIKRAVESDRPTLEALREVRDIAVEMRHACEKGDWSVLPELFSREFKARVRLSESFSSPEIERLDVLARKKGALATKICGAGGGGCVMLWVPPDRREAVIRDCTESGFQVLDARPVKG